MGCVSFAQMYFPGGTITRENFQRARMAAVQKLENPPRQYRIQGWNVALGASGTIKAAHEVLLAMGEKDGFITPERLTLLTDEVLKHKSFDALSLPGLSDERKAVFVPGLAILCGVFDALAIKELRLSDGALREGVLYEMEGRFRHQDIRSRTAQSPPTSTTSTASRRSACWTPRCRCMNSGKSRIRSWRTRSLPRC